MDRLFKTLSSATQRILGESIVIKNNTEEFTTKGIFSLEVLIVNDVQAEYLTCDVLKTEDYEILKTTEIIRASKTYLVDTYTVSADEKILKLILREQ